MDEEEAGKSPQKDEDAVATIPASKSPPKVNHEESNSENVAAELHNGSGHVSSEEAENNKESAGTPEGEEEQDPDHSVNSGSEKWKLHLDVSDSASTTTDNEGSEVEDKCDESRDNILIQKKDDTPKNVQSEESEDFRGFETPASDGLEQLNKLIDEAEKDLLHTVSDSDTEVQETPGVVSSSSKVAVEQKNFEDVRIGDQKVRFTFRVIGKCDGTEDEDDDESMKVVTAENSDVSRDVDDSMDEMSRDGKLTTIKQEFQEKVEEEDASSMEVTSQMDSQFDGRKFANEVSSEVTSSADVASSAKTDSGPAMEDLTVSEVTSSATSSPSLSSRSSLKVGLGVRRSRGDSPALSGGNRGKKVTVDLSNPAFRKPLELGWKRELVYRNTSEASNKKMADIYYYTPLGKKVRSNREVLEHLSGMDLTLDNFTFFKEPLGIDDPTKEIIRDAKKISMKDPTITPVKKTPKTKTTPVAKVQEIATASPATPETLAVGDSKTQEKPPEPQEPQQPSTPKSIPAAVTTTPTDSKITTKIKGSNAKAKKSPYSRIAPKSKESSKSGETEMGMLPPWWCPKKSGDGTGTLSLTSSKSDSATWSEKDSQPPAKRLKALSTPDEQHFMQYFMTNVSAGYSSMLHVFQYLKVQELLRAARVCRMWRDLAAHPSLWQTVRMKNSQVVDWKGFAESLQRRGTQHLDLRKMLVPGDDTEHMWDEFRRHIGQVTSLSALDLCRCPSRVVESIATTCPQLKVINALSIKCDLINLSVLGSLKNLQELRLKSLCGIVLTSSLVPLKHLTGLKHLSLTTFKDLGKKDPLVLGSLKNLESLELGECCDMPDKFGPEALSQLKKLERLRLEKGQGKSCPTFSILHGVCMLPKLTHLELINFDVKPGFDEALAQCTNIRRLLIIPTYVTQSATTNHMVLNGVNQLRNTLTHFVWGITHELLRVTELFVDQCEGQKDKSTSGTSSKGSKKFQGGDSIPILKPAEGSLLFVSPKEDTGEDPSGESKSAGDATSGTDEPKDEADEKAKAPQVEILPLPKLQKFLTSSLTKTKVQILKIPFHATWRQNISETTS